MTTMSVQNLVDKTGISRYLVTKALNELHIEIGHHQTKISESQMAKLEATFKAIKAGNKALKTRPAAKPAAKPKAAKPKAAKPAVTKPAAKPKAMKPLAKTAKPAAKPMTKVDARPAASALKPEANSAPKLQDTDGLHD